LCPAFTVWVWQLKTTRAVADTLGISQRTVERYVKDQIRQPNELVHGRR
jgi:predicted transcriptional regulator